MITLLLLAAPGRVSSLSTVPDILSVVLNWDHPLRGVGHITQYEIRHMLESSLLGINGVSGDQTSYRVRGLQPDMQYRFEIRPFIGTLEGPSLRVIARTLTINRKGNIILYSCRGLSHDLSLSFSPQVRYGVYLCGS